MIERSSLDCGREEGGSCWLLLTQGTHRNMIVHTLIGLQQSDRQTPGPGREQRAGRRRGVITRLWTEGMGKLLN